MELGIHFVLVGFFGQYAPLFMTVSVWLVKCGVEMAIQAALRKGVKLTLAAYM